MTVDKSTALNASTAYLFREFGPTVIQRACDLPPLEVIPTGLPGLDTATEIGGIPKGRIVEITGHEGAGKSALAIRLAQQVHSVLYIDADCGLSARTTWELVNWHDGFYLLSVDTMEDALQACLYAAPAFDMIVIDTLAALPTREELSSSLEECYCLRDSQAKVLSKMLPRLQLSLSKSGCTCVMVNQLRERPGVMMGNKEYSTGGRALKHYSSMRFDVCRTSNIIEGEVITGQRVRVRVEKNKCSAAYKSADIELRYTIGVISA